MWSETDYPGKFSFITGNYETFNGTDVTADRTSFGWMATTAINKHLFLFEI